MILPTVYIPAHSFDGMCLNEYYHIRGVQSAHDLMQSGKWEEAEKAFQRVIEIGDCLPQPWGNLGTCMIMQERYDEAEAALKRALEIDLRYAIAKQNLALLPETRRTGPPKMVGMLDPFKATKVKQEITFVVE